MIEEQKIIDDSLEKIKSWLSEGEAILMSTLRLDASAEVLEEQKTNYRLLIDESKSLLEDFIKLQCVCDKIMLKMKSASKLQFQNDMKNLKERLHRMQDSLEEKLQLLEDAIVHQKEQKWQLDESNRKIEEIKVEVQHLSRPIGPSIFDVESILEKYETTLNHLQDLNKRLQCIKPLPCFVDEYNNLLTKYQEFIQLVQDKYMKAKQSLLLREQYHSLIKEVTETVYSCNENLKSINEEELTVDQKLSKFQTILDDIIQCEATYTKAGDKGEQIAKEGTASDCNKIMDELQKLRCKLNELKKTVNNLKIEHENLVAEQKKYVHDLDSILERLRNGISGMQSQPLLTRHSIDVQKEIIKHKDIASDLNKCLNEASLLCNCIDKEIQKRSFSASFLEQFEECSLFQQTLPLAMEKQLQYLKSSFDFRKEFETLTENLNRWLTCAEKLLEVSSTGIDFQSVDFRHLELQKYFADISSQENKLSEIQKLGSQIHPTLLEDQIPLLDSEIDSLKKKLSEVFNLADRTITEVEVDCILWKEYRELFDKISNIMKAPIPDEKPTNVVEISSSIKRLSQHLQEMQKNDESITELNEKARSLDRRANMSSSDFISKQMSNINNLWQDRLCSIENQVSALTDILNQWEVYSEVDSNIQTSLLGYERRLEDICSFQVINEDNLKNLQQDVKELENSINNLLSLSTGVLSYLNSIPSGFDGERQLRDHLLEIQNRYKKLMADTEIKLKQVLEENEAVKKLDGEITVIKEKIHKIEEKIKVIDCYIDNLDDIDRTMTDVREEVTTITETVKTITTETKDSFRTKNYSIPDSVTKIMSSLELLTEATTSILENKERDYKKARGIRLDYTEALDAVVAWLQKAQEQLQDKSNLPEAALEDIKILLSEVLPVKSKLDSVRRNGLLIAESTKNANEKQIILTSISSIEDQMSKVESWLYEREVQIKDAVIALGQFLESQNNVQSWIQKVELYLSQDTEILVLQDAKQKLSDLQSFSKESQQVQQHIKNMGKKLEKISEACSSGDLADMLDNIEQDESSTDSRLLEQISLLQEMVEEWEQCERKIKEVATWVDKNKSYLDSPHFKKRTLRDQLTYREKMMSDMSVQKTKVLMALEKLQVHLRSHTSGQHQILTRGQSVQEELEALQSQFEEKCEVLQVCVSQEDQYQQDLQSLKHAMSQADHQVKLANNPSIIVEEKEKLKELQEISPEKKNALPEELNNL